MKIIISDVKSEVVVEIFGRIDTSTVVIFENELIPIMEYKGKTIVLDCQNLEYINSSGLRTFLTLQKQVLQNSSQLILRNMNEDIKDIFDMIGFSEIFNIQ